MKFTLPKPEFTFAGFTFPKWLWTLPKSPVAGIPIGQLLHRDVAKLLKAKRRGCVGPTYHAPKPSANNQGPYELSGRWQWADDVNPHIRHTGWWCDDFQEGKMRGVVIRLTRGRGFLAGWSMGENMASHVETDHVFDDAIEAANAADEIARAAADNERDYQADRDAAEAREEAELVADELESDTQFDAKFGVEGACSIQRRAADLIVAAEALGIVLTITEIPDIPSTSGSHGLMLRMRPAYLNSEED